MHGRYMDAMALVRTYGKPDLFITMTCNPKWPEIVDNLLPGQSAEDRPDLCARVFKGYLEALVKELYTDGCMGKHVAHAHVIEFQVSSPIQQTIRSSALSPSLCHGRFDRRYSYPRVARLPQKRGLPHAHILIILSGDDRITDPEHIDKAVRAELPPVDCRLRRTVLNCMVHRDCSNDPTAPCRKGGAPCEKRCVSLA